MMDAEQVRRVIQGADEFLDGPGDGLAWIKQSSLHLRAFYWGLDYGLSQVATEEDCKSVIVHMLTKTMFARPGDDPTRGTALGKELGALVDELSRALSSDRTEGTTLEELGLSGRIDALLRHVERLDSEWDRHCGRCRDALVEMQGGETSARRARETLDCLEPSFRVLALSDSA